VLIEEAGLGRVADPAGGSWYIERLTDDLARAAWARFQAIEAKGGLGPALEGGHVQDELAAAAKARAGRIATGRQELTGTSAFPRLGDDGVKAEPWPDAVPSAELNGVRVRPVAMRRDAEPFEALRDRADAHAERTGRPPAVFLASLGPLAVHSVRTTWMRNFLAAGGIEGSGGEGWTASADVGRAFAGSGAAIACLCSSDAVYGELGEAAASALKAAGAARVYVAGRQKEDAAALLKAAGVDAFIHAGMDMPVALGELHEALGVA
jgi:methylmalonyl-CoA mutase